MSELTMCNHCSMLGLERRAKVEGRKLVMAKAPPMVPGWGAGTAVYKLPKGMTVA